MLHAMSVFLLMLFCGIPSSVLYGEMCSRVQEMQQDVAQRVSNPPGGVQSRNHANFSPFSRHHARISPLSRNHTNWSHFSTFTQSRTYFFRFHAITQITQMRKGFSRHHAHQKDLSRITHTCQLHAITQLFFHFHAITQFSRNKKGYSRNHANLWGGLVKTSALGFCFET